MIFLIILVFLSKKKRENANDISDIFGFLEQKLGFIIFLNFCMLAKRGPLEKNMTGYWGMK